MVAMCLSVSCFLTAQEASLDSIWKEIQLEDIVVTAQYAPTNSKNAVHAVKVIQAIDIQRQGQNNLAEVLTNQLNLRVNTDPILGNGLAIQGIGGQNVQVMIDGVPIIGRQNGNIDLSQINLNHIERIEIIEGAMSAQYGSNASGGVINLITKQSQLEPYRIELQNQYESVGIWNNSLSVGTQFGQLYGALNVTRFHSQFAEEDSLRLFQNITLSSGETGRTRVNPWNPKLQYGLDATLRYRFSDSLSLTYQFRYFDEVVDMFGEKRRLQFQPYAFDQEFTTLRKDHSLRLEGHLGNKFYLNTTSAYNEYDRFRTTNRLDFETGRISVVNGEQDTTEFSAFLHRSILSTTLPGALNGQFGLEVLHETGSGDRIVDTTSTPINQSSLTNYAAWLGLRYDLSKSIEWGANLRYGYNTKYDHPLVPALHMIWKPQKDWLIRLNYANGFRAPTLKELYNNFIDVNHFIVGNPDLKPENSQNLSLSIDREFTWGTNQKITLTGKLFYNYIEDRIVLAEFEPAKFNYQNLDQFETNGINIQLNYQHRGGLQLKSGFAYTRLYNAWAEDFATDKFVGLPEWQNELHYSIPTIGTNLVLTHRYIGRQIRFFQNSEGLLEEGYIGDYHLMNATLSRGLWNNRVFLAAGVKNLLDTDQIPVVGQGGGGAHSGGGNSQLLNWGRTYFVRLNVAFSH